jgi:cyclopropane fatty-acyl-phospholipid synthase-like methyltransferase
MSAWLQPHCFQHVGIRRYGIFLKQMYDLLDDNGIFVLQVAGIRPTWQFEDLVWYIPSDIP